MRKILLTVLLLCACLVTGCYDDYYPEDSAVETETGTVIDAGNRSTEDETETMEECSDMMCPTDAPEQVWVMESLEETAEEVLPKTELTDITEESTLMTEASTEMTESAIMTESTIASELTTPDAPEQITETETTVIPTETELITEPGCSDYDKALAVYEYMLENGYGTCVNYACQTYEKCQEIELTCYIVWTDARLYGHVANTVQVNGIWFILDTQGSMFLTYNPGFTEAIDMDMNHIGDAEMLSSYRYDELFG